MSRLQNVIKGMVELYEEYSDADGKISKEEMMKMVDKEVECSEMKEKLKAKKCDKNPCDGEIDFRDFARCVGTVAVCCYQKKTGKGQAWGDCSKKC